MKYLRMAEFIKNQGGDNFLDRFSIVAMADTMTVNEALRLLKVYDTVQDLQVYSCNDIDDIRQVNGEKNFDFSKRIQPWLNSLVLDTLDPESDKKLFDDGAPNFVLVLVYPYNTTARANLTYRSNVVYKNNDSGVAGTGAAGVSTGSGDGEGGKKDGGGRYRKRKSKKRKSKKKKKSKTRRRRR
tara:strand:+ start:835 stop:1386 length:552 start_codon:yes stop_codon:yes gene_type:complete